MIEDGAYERGSVTMVQRVGDTIRRPVGRWTPVVHALLRYLEARGFAGATRMVPRQMRCSMRSSACNSVSTNAWCGSGSGVLSPGVCCMSAAMPTRSPPRCTGSRHIDLHCWGITAKVCMPDIQELLPLRATEHAA